MAADRRAKGLAWIALPFAAALVTVLARFAGANATTAGFAYLLLVLGLATWGGWAVGAAASVVAMACFNFFFLPPYGTLTIQDPSNWVALVTFLVASTVASRLVATARQRAEEAQSRRREVEILYDLCFGLFAASQRPGILGEAAARTLQAIGAESGGLYLAGEEAPVTTLGHEPLTAMRLEIESLEGRLANQPEALASLGGLSLEQERLSRRIDNLLSLARLEAGVARPRPEPVPPFSLFRAARESLSLILAGRPVEVRVEPRCPDAWADPSLALETLVNLLENAARAAPPGEPLELAAGRDPDDRERIRLEVLDRGPGLPPGVKRMLQGARDLRRTADAAAGDSASGGLGLQIARGLAEANGGSLALLDRPGGGTMARLILPAASEPPNPEEAEP